MNEHIQKLARINGHKYLTPEMREESEALIAKLKEDGSIMADTMFGFSFGITFIGPNAEENSAIYQKAFGEQLLGKRINENHL